MPGQARRGARVALVAMLACTSATRSAEFDEFADDPSAFSTVIEARDYDDRFATVEDVLRDAPGVHVRRFGGLGAYSTAGIRGSKPEQVLVLLDGVRLNSSGRGAVDLSTLPLRLVERIEVVRGGGAGRYGSDAVGGVVSITSRRPDDVPAVDLAGTTGEYGTLGMDALASGGRGAQAGLAGYSRLRAENDFRFDRSFDSVNFPARLRARPDERFTRRNAELLEQTGLLRYLAEVGETSDVAATLQLHGSDRGQPGSLFYNSTFPGSESTVNCLGAEEDFRRAVASVDWGDGALGPGAFALSAFHRTEETGLHDPGGLCGMVVPTERGFDRVESTDAQTGAEASYATRWFSLGPASLRSRASGGLRRDHLRGDETPSAERWVTNLFALEEVRLIGGRLRVFPSVGLELASTGSVETAVPGLPGATTEVRPDDSAEWIPKLGAIATLVPGLRVKANLGRAFRRPNFGELFLPDLGYVRGNPNLEPEDARNFDVGIEASPPDFGPISAISFEVVRFHSDIEQGIEFVRISSFTVAPVNTGESQVRGWELGAAFTIADQLDLSGSYTFQDTEVESQTVGLFGQPREPALPHRPRNQLSARARLRARMGSVWVETRFEDEYSIEETAEWATDPVWQVDLGVAVTLSELPGLRWVPSRLELSTEWVNVGAQERIDSLGFPLPGRLWYLRLRSRTTFGDGPD